MRLLFFYLVLLAFQGFISALIAPLPVPDLFLLMVLTPIRRLKAWQLILVAYGAGLLQDLIGNGVFGLHAFALATGVFFALMVKDHFSHGLFSQVIIVLVALLGKWLAMIPMIFWLGSSPSTLHLLYRVIPYEFAFTVIAGIFVLPWAEALMQRALLAKEK